MPDQAFCFSPAVCADIVVDPVAHRRQNFSSLIEDMNEPTIDCNVPTVLMGSNVAGAPFDIITLDEHRADRPATPCLLNFGHRIGVLAGRRGVSTNDERLEGCRLAFAELGLTLSEVSVEHANFSEDLAFEATCRFMPCKG
jgi:DNA-binding LacI/PurR family transcriptional regulator